VEAVLLADGGALFVSGLLMGFIMSMIRVEKVSDLPDLILEMNCLYLGIIQLGILQLVAKALHFDLLYCVFAPREERQAQDI